MENETRLRKTAAMIYEEEVRPRAELSVEGKGGVEYICK